MRTKDEGEPPRAVPMHGGTAPPILSGLGRSWPVLTAFGMKKVMVDAYGYRETWRKREPCGWIGILTLTKPIAALVAWPR